MIDHYISAVQGRLKHTFGEQQGYTCGTIFVDHATGKIFNYCQLSNDASNTLGSKHKGEQEHAKAERFTIKKYHSENGVFTFIEFKGNCEKLGQNIDLSGVGTQHQNGVTEQNTRAISSWGRANMLHAVYHWPWHAWLKLWPLC